ncbi:MAG: uncharacterized protein KVP18_000928 [Porospora cf. gigantea A]|uniref:uncharacterized protein n=1 Tax=Porospora cf. gigantea A TaxID=2853593 RepID=UPI003559E501|nr:MAG: hypothetical protein KVP18_000928 [Porospora cf. gigantea A]
MCPFNDTFGYSHADHSSRSADRGFQLQVQFDSSRQAMPTHHGFHAKPRRSMHRAAPYATFAAESLFKENRPPMNDRPHYAHEYIPPQRPFSRKERPEFAFPWTSSKTTAKCESALSSPLSKEFLYPDNHFADWGPKPVGLETRMFDSTVRPPELRADARFMKSALSTPYITPKIAPIERGPVVAQPSFGPRTWLDEEARAMPEMLRPEPVDYEELTQKALGSFLLCVSVAHIADPVFNRSRPRMGAKFHLLFLQ